MNILTADHASDQNVKLSFLAKLAVLLLLIAAPGLKAQDYAEMIMKATGVPSLEAFLPSRYDVAKTDAMVIDGVWNISLINKKILIEQGRAVVIDPWTHLWVLKIRKDMVVMKDLKYVDVGKYSGYDLPLLGASVLTLKPDGNISVEVQGMMGPVKFELQQRELTYPEYMQQELAAMAQRRGSHQRLPPPQIGAPPAYVGNPSPPPQQTYPQPYPPQPQPVQPTYPPAPPQPEYRQPVQQPPSQPTPPDANCTPIGIDPDTGATICA